MPILVSELGTMPSQSVTVRSPELPPFLCSCMWSMHVLMDEEREKDGQFPRVWSLKFIHRACRVHGSLT